MRTYILSDLDVAGYLADLVDRLFALGDDLPTTWCSIGPSGDKVVAAMLDLVPKSEIARIDLRRLTYSRSSREVVVQDPDRDKPFPKSILIIDGPIHSGRTMRQIAKWLQSKGVSEIASYGLVVKRTSEFVPSYFGLMIGEHDRAYFQFDKIPNHRLRKKGPFGVLRKIEAEDTKSDAQYLDAGDNSLSDISLSDLWYLKETRGDHVYLYEVEGKLAGFIHFALVKDKQSMVVDAVAAAVDQQGRDIGGLLMRWAENWARNHRLLSVDLYSLQERIGFYKHIGYELTPEPPLHLKEETLHRMRRKLLYNIDPEMLRI